MKNPIKTGIALFLACLISATAMAGVPQLSEKMTQGQFAVWLVQAIGASRQLPAAPTDQDAIDFLTRLNVQPAGGWKKDAVITKQFLSSLLGDDSAAGLDFDVLINKVRDYVTGIFNDSHLGIFRAFSTSASGSVTI